MPDYLSLRRGSRVMIGCAERRLPGVTYGEAVGAVAPGLWFYLQWPRFDLGYRAIIAARRLSSA